MHDAAQRSHPVRLAAHLLLLGAVALYVYSSQLPADVAYRELMLALSEAAMVGGLADWFAVSALFRRPLGLPIPHTAIIPANKERIGHNFGLFVQKNFLAPEVLQGKIAGVDFAGIVFRWLSRQSNARVVVYKGIGVFRPFLETVSDDAISKVILRGLRKLLQGVPLTPYLGKLLQFVFSGDRSRAVTDELFRMIAQLVDENKGIIRKRVREESPWFIPDFIDTRVYEKIVQELKAFFSAILSDPNHPFRVKFSEKMTLFARKLETDELYRGIGESIKEDLLTSESIRAIALDILVDMKFALNEKLASPDDGLLHGLAELLSEVAQAICENDELRENLNSWTRTGILHASEEYGVRAADFISDTVKTWDTSTLVDKFEMEIGRDLQFIRVNGTLVGGLLGIVIYLLKSWLE